MYISVYVYININSIRIYEAKHEPGCYVSFERASTRVQDAFSGHVHQNVT